MKQNKNSRFVVGVLIVAILGVISVGAVWVHGRIDAAPKPKRTSGSAITSMFSFTGTPDWWQGATNQTSMALFHDDSTDGCFVSAEYHAGTVNVASETQKEQATLTSGGYTVASTGVQTLTLRIVGDPIQYQLQQYDVTGSAGTTQVMAGQEFGYIQLTGGYIKMMGYCNTTDELSATIPALEAFKLDKTN